MGWAIGYDEHWQRDIGYGVPAICDHPDCSEEIDRGLSYVCANQEPREGRGDKGGGCGLYFCAQHLRAYGSKCERCAKYRKPFKPKPDTLKWLYFKMVDPSWEEWRKENGLTTEAVGIEGAAQEGE